MIALYTGVFAFVSLIFDYINYAFPDTALNYYYVDPYQGGVSYEMASLIVLAPVLLILMRVIRRAIATDPTRNEIWVRRWGLFLTVFLAGAAIVVDLIILLTSFLNGEDLTVRFLLKIAVVLLVAAAGFMHFMADLWGYWQKKPEYARYVNWAVAVLVVFTIGAGFLIIGTPQSQRAYRLDQQRVSDLQQIQSEVISYWQAKQTLPATLDQLNDPSRYVVVPIDPAIGASYVYRTTGSMSFTICATFAAPSTSVQETGTNVYNGRMIPVPAGKMGVQDTWNHGTGEGCFNRTIDPDFYPPLTKTF